jgi:polar amino acid transport system permease protein
MALNKRQRARLVRFGVYGLTLAVVAFLAIKADWSALSEAFFDPEIFREQFPEIVTIAAKNTLIITVLSFGFAVVFGLVLALMRLSTIKPYRWFASVWIEIFRGLPAILTLIAVGFAIPIALDFRIEGRYGAPVVGIGIVYSAYLAETIRAGIEAVPRGQMEAARSLGMSYGRAMVSIIIPQGFRVIIPPMTNEFIALIKDTSLVGIVLGTTSESIELTKFARDGVSRTFSITPLVAAGLIYLAITIPLTRLVAVLERRAAKAR